MPNVARFTVLRTRQTEAEAKAGDEAKDADEDRGTKATTNSPFVERPPVEEAVRAVAEQRNMQGGCAFLSPTQNSESLPNHVELINIVDSQIHNEVSELALSAPPPLSHTTAGRVANCLPNWEIITKDPLILTQVRGVQLDLITPPVQRKPPNWPPSSPSEQVLMDTEIQKLLDKGAIIQTSPTNGQFLSHLFLRKKKDGSYRPIINLKGLNKFIKYQHFKMENIPMLSQLTQRADWCVKIDLKDAYFCIAIAPQHRKLLRFQWKNKTFQFQTLPFGLGSAPRTFTKMMKPIVSLLRRIGVRMLIYLDDLIILNQSRERLLKDRDSTIWMLQCLGLVINTEKSVLEPTRKLEYLGFMLDTMSLTLSLSDTKLASLQSECRALAQTETTTVRELASLIGKLAATKLAVLPAPLHFRHLQMHAARELLKSGHSYETIITITPQCKSDLRWWIDHLGSWNGKSLLTPAPDLTITSDASKEGWGATTNSSQVQGRWSATETTLHINVLELTAAGLALRAFTKQITNQHVHLRLDNSTAVALIMKMGTTRSPALLQVAQQIWDYALQKQITLTAEHLPGVTNTTADRLSREFQDSSSWKLDRSTFDLLQQTRGPWEVDMFADRLTHQLPKYMSWKADPGSIQTDAFQIQWGRIQGYAFPPFCLIDRCLAKVQKDRATITIVTPTWQSQVWYPTLLQLSIRHPILLPNQRNLLTDGRGNSHPLTQDGSLSLAAWTVSGITSLRQDFLRSLPPYYFRDGGAARNPLTVPPGTNGVAGVTASRLIHFKPLWHK